MAHECPHDGTPAFGLSCCYGHMKALLREGAALSAEERAFIGIYPQASPRGRWRQPDTIDDPGETLSASDSAILAGMMGVGDTRPTGGGAEDLAAMVGPRGGLPGGGVARRAGGLGGNRRMGDVAPGGAMRRIPAAEGPGSRGAP